MTHDESDLEFHVANLRSIRDSQEQMLATCRSTIESQAAEIARLRAELEVIAAEFACRALDGKP